jgi:hypothetical protein
MICTRVLCLALYGVIGSAAVAPWHAAAATEVWFAPPDNLPRGSKQFNRDFPELFVEPPPWNTHVDVLQIPPYYAAKAKDEELLNVAGFLIRHHIDLAVGVQPVQINEECSPTEGLTHPKENFGIFRRLRHLGLDIKYVGLDEPLTYGHYYNRGLRPCRLSVGDVAVRVGATIAEIRGFYPDAKVVDYEAPAIAPIESWPSDLAAWLREYQQTTGRPLDAIVFDVDWRGAWVNWVRSGIEVAHGKGIRAGIFLTIAGPGTSDTNAVASLRTNIQTVDAANLLLDLTILSCWTPYPSRSVPASDPKTLTSVLNWYLAQHGRAP